MTHKCNEPLTEIQLHFFSRVRLLFRIQVFRFPILLTAAIVLQSELEL